jgi:hypothetical protein
MVRSGFAIAVVSSLLVIACELIALGQQAVPPLGSSSRTTNPPSSRAAGGSAPCAPILQLSSPDWIAKYTAEHTTSPDDTIAAINAYAQCYQARTNRLAASLEKSGKGPPKGASAKFRDFQAALENFSAKALAARKPPADPLTTAYTSLYALGFRYEFLESYEPKAERNRALAQQESEEYAKAKNRLGELFGLLPMDQFHEVHSAFSQILTASEINDVTKLEVYRYAIFILARPGEKPFSPPPF